MNFAEIRKELESKRNRLNMDPVTLERERNAEREKRKEVEKLLEQTKSELESTTVKLLEATKQLRKLGTCFVVGQILLKLITFLHFPDVCLFVCVFGLKYAEIQVKVEQETALRTETKKVKELEEKVRTLEQELETRRKHERTTSRSVRLVCIKCSHSLTHTPYNSNFITLLICYL
jgi:DNA-binding transcriptional MerR regulator